MAGKLSKQDAIEQRVHELVSAMGKLVPEYKLRKAFCARWGVSRRTFDRVLTRARAEIAGEYGMSRADLKAQTCHALDSLLSLEYASVKDRIAGLKLRAEILGLLEPRIIHVGGPAQTVDGRLVEELRLRMLTEHVDLAERHLDDKGKQHGCHGDGESDMDPDGLRCDGEPGEVPDAESPKGDQPPSG